MTDHDVLEILKKSMDDASIDVNSDQGKAVSLYKSILDLEGRNKQGVAPVLPELEKIDAITSITELQSYLTQAAPKGGRGFFSTYVGADSKDSNKNVVYLGAGSLGLPDRDYYVKDDEDSKDKREKYVAHVAKMLQYIGSSERRLLLLLLRNKFWLLKLR